VRCNILGPTQVLRHGEELDVGPAQQRTILTLLLLRAGQPVSFTEVVDLLWPEGAPMSATNTVHRYLGRIRRMFGDAGEGPGRAGRLARTGGCYALDVDPKYLDIAEFRSLVARARHVATPHRQLDLLEQALLLWRGRCGVGSRLEYSSCALVGQVNREYSEAAITVAQAAQLAQQPQRALRWLEQAAEWDPWNEAILVKLLNALADLGQHAEAMSRLRAYRARLADELGVDPGRELQATHAQLLSDTVSEARPGPIRTGPERPGAPEVTVIVVFGAVRLAPLDVAES
jgi:DNA-binding SARP family transcriptional activator